MISSAILSIDGWRWQTTVVLGLQTLESILLLLAAGSVFRDTPATS